MRQIGELRYIGISGPGVLARLIRFEPKQMIPGRGFAVLVAAGLLTGMLGCDRGPKRLPESGFQVEFPSHKIAAEMTAGETVVADITVKNASPVSWPSKPDHKNRYAVNLSYHWLDRNREVVVFDGLRTPLPRDLGAGESADLKAAIRAPEKPGRYILEVTLVQEQSAWFPEKNGAKLTLPVRVVDRSEVAAAPVSAAMQRSDKPVKAGAQPASGEQAPKKAIAARSVAGTGEPDARGGGPWSVQLAAYADKVVAEKLAQKLKAKGYDAYVTTATIKGKPTHRVRVGQLARQAEAEKLRETLRVAEKFDQAIVTRR